MYLLENIVKDVKMYTDEAKMFCYCLIHFHLPFASHHSLVQLIYVCSQLHAPNKKALRISYLNLMWNTLLTCFS